MKKAWNIIWRTALGVVLAVYICVALLNYSVVQSAIGSEAGRRLSEAWGGEVRIGSVHINPFYHLIANELLMVAPDGDTIFNGETLRVRFKGFPFHGDRLKLHRVYVRNTYYHLAIYRRDDPEAPAFVRDMPNAKKKRGLNLQYIFNHYYHGPRKHKSGAQFTVDIDEVVLDHVHYKMDLPDRRETKYDYGVAIPHMEFYDIQSKITKVHVVNDDVTCRLVRLSTEERSGFRANDIAARVHVSSDDITVKGLKVDTDRSRVRADVEITYDGWHGMDDYLRDVQHNITLGEETTVAMADVAYWVPLLWGKEIQMMPSGTVSGTVDKMHTDGMSLRLGNTSGVMIEGDIEGLTNPKNMAVELSNLAIRFEESDLRQICAMMPEIIKPRTERLLRQLQYIELDGQMHGGLQRESAANVHLVCGLGNLSADATMIPTERGRRVVLNADSDGMGLTPLGSDWLTHSGLTLNMDAELPDDLGDLRHIEGEAVATLTNCVVKGNNINPIDLHAEMRDGKVDFAATCADTLLNADVSGTAKLTDDERVYHARVDLKHLQADAFSLTKAEYGDIRTSLEANFKGNSIDGLRGMVRANGTRIGRIGLDDISLSVTSDDSISKNLRLESDVVTASANGHFSYADLPLMVRHIASEVLPEDLHLVVPPDSVALEAIAQNTVNFHLRVNDSRLVEQIIPKLGLATGTRIDGTYNGNDLLRLVARSDEVRIASVKVGGVGLSTHHDRAGYHVSVESSEIVVGAMEMMQDIDLGIRSDREGADLGIAWGDSTQVTHGDLMLAMRGGDISVSRPDFYIGDIHWTLGIDSMHLTTVPHPTLTGHGIKLDSEKQHIDARVSLQRQDNDCVELTFDNFDLGPLSSLLLQESPLNVSGDVDGRFTLYGLSATPYFNANLTIDSCMLNQQELGHLGVRSNWNAEMNTLNLMVDGKTLNATGWLGLGESDPDIDFAVTFDQFELASIAPLLATFSSRFEGQLEGELDINGTLGKPNIVGEAYIDDGALKVDLTGVTYYFNDSIRFTNNRIRLDRFKLIDPLGNIATVDGEISHNGIDNISIDLGVQTDNMLVLSQRSGESFYGTMLVEATGRVSGSNEMLNISVNARTNPGSTLTVPVSDRRQVQSQDFITFVGSNDIADEEQRPQKRSGVGFNIELDLTITPDVMLNLPMDFSELSVGVRGSGNGDLHMSLDNRMEPQVMGNYEITSGTLKLSFISLLEKTFSLEPGSNMNFQGSLPDARFDLQAVYGQRVNLSTLTGGFSAVDNTEKYIQVEDIISINGTLNEPSISFDLRLPNSDASIEEEVFAYIDRNSERDMLNQTISLLLLGQFYNANGTMNENTDLLGSGLSSGYSMVASKMGSMVSDMVNIVDVDFKYKAATEMTNEQVDVNISKDWGRWYLESTLGYGGDSRELESNANGNAVIDALLGYRITPMIHVYAYNRTNNNDYTRIDLPYKQGAGLKLTKDFDRWSELITKKKKRK